METVDSGEVAPGAPQPMHINVHIHQESALAKLLTSGCSLLRSHFPGATFQTWSRSRLLLASWVSSSPEDLPASPYQEKKTLFVLCTPLARLSELDARQFCSISDC